MSVTFSIPYNLPNVGSNEGKVRLTKEVTDPYLVFLGATCVRHKSSVVNKAKSMLQHPVCRCRTRGNTAGSQAAGCGTSPWRVHQSFAALVRGRWRQSPD